MTYPKGNVLTPRCNCGSPCNRCLKRCTCSVHWHHENQVAAMDEARKFNKGKYKAEKRARTGEH